MRSGSTLLVHLLLTSPELISAGEQNAVYQSVDDLVRLEVSARWSHRAPFRGVRFAVDQMNHDHLLPDPDLLANPRIRPLFVIREPGPTIRSILELTRIYYEPWTVERAVEYYTGRLESLAGYARRIRPAGALAVTYEDLVRRPADALRCIEAFLGLDHRLRAEYRRQRFTGKRGDPSPTIRSGAVQTRTVEPESMLPEYLLDDALTAHRQCMAALGRFDALGPE